MRLLLLLLLLPGLLAAQKKTTGEWKTDTFRLYAIGNSCIDFYRFSTGHMKQWDSRTWIFQRDTTGKPDRYQVPVRTYASPPALFDDCVYFNLPTQLHSGEDHYSPYKGRVTNAQSLRFYTSHLAFETAWNQRLVTDTLPLSAVLPYYLPFYFRKYEVSNEEYREFVNWVRDSVMRRMLAKNGFGDDYLISEEELYRPYRKIPGFDNYTLFDTIPKDEWPLNWKQKILWDEDSPDYTSAFKEIFLSKTERFWHRKEIDPRKLVYKFAHAPSEYGHDTINIYPDTLSWVNDFPWTFQEHEANMYFWYPSYANYPVVGVTYWQCMAFLEWKSKQLTQQLNREKKPYRVVCALPSEREWDLASTAEIDRGELTMLGSNYAVFCDQSWMTDLRLFVDTSKSIRIYEMDDTIQAPHYHSKRPNLIGVYNPTAYSVYREFLLENEITPGDYISDRGFHPLPVDLHYRPEKNVPRETKRKQKAHKKDQVDFTDERFNGHLDKQTGIYFLDGNVSEWLREDLDSTWRPLFEKHLPLVKGPEYEQYQLIRTIENYYFHQLPPHGKLVRGCNWYDERYSNKYGKNTAGMNAKTFCEPNQAYSTIGFRYVIYVYPKN